MAAAGTITLRARYVFPVVGKPLEASSVTIQGDRILAVGRSDAAAGDTDLGNAAILPGLVNAHTHLEFSDLSTPLGQSGMGLPEWIRHVLAVRGEESRSEDEAITAGLAESRAAGTTLVGEIATRPWNSELNTSADVTVFWESIGASAERQADELAAAERHLAGPWPAAAIQPGLSPHAPYSVHPQLLEELVALAQRESVPAAMHLAESREELELLATGRGPMAELLLELGALAPGDFSTPTRALDYLRTLATAPRALVVHGNYLDSNEIDFLAEHRRHMSLVYCPRTHAYFGHRPYPLAQLLAAGVAVALGTDSRASNPDLNLWNELRFAAERHPNVAPRTLLELATLGGARALGRDDDCGMLAPGKLANLAVVTLPESRAADPHELLLTNSATVVQTWWRGKRVKL